MSRRTRQPAPVPGAPRAREQAPPKGEPRAKSKPDQAKALAPDPSTLVEETWSRWNEWGLNLIVVGAWSAVFLLLVYLVFGQEYYGLAFVLLIVGLAVAVVLSYPMLITLGACPGSGDARAGCGDYYAALSHHVPHLRRMWLLLSTAGRTSSAFGSFEGFKGYWRDQLARLHKGHAGALTPLVFEVVNFKSEKSAGKPRIDATYTLSVSVRGQRSKVLTVHTFSGPVGLVRGPDNMWYLESGTLPREKPVRTLIEPAE